MQNSESLSCVKEELFVKMSTTVARNGEQIDAGSNCEMVA